MVIGERLKLARKQAKLSQSELARRAKVTPSAISQMEAGITKKPSAENLLPIAKALKINPEWLMTGKGERSSEFAGYQRPDGQMPKESEAREAASAQYQQPISDFQTMLDAFAGSMMPQMNDIFAAAMEVWLQDPANQRHFCAYLGDLLTERLGSSLPQEQLLQIVQDAVRQREGESLGEQSHQKAEKAIRAMERETGIKLDKKQREALLREFKRQEQDGDEDGGEDDNPLRAPAS